MCFAFDYSQTVVCRPTSC